MSTFPFTCRDEDSTGGIRFRVRSLGGTPIGAVECRLQIRGGADQGGWLAYDRDHKPIFDGACFPERLEAAWAVHLAERAYQGSADGEHARKAVDARARGHQDALDGRAPRPSVVAVAFDRDYKMGYNSAGMAVFT